MAIVIEAKEAFWRERGFYPRVSVRSDGVYVQRYFRVDTDDPEQSLFAMGLPKIGDSHPAYQDSFVVAIDTEPLGGTDTATQRGWHMLTVRYEPIKVSTIDAIAQPGYAFTQINASTGGQTIRFAVDGITKIPQYVREADQVELIVTAYHTNTAWLQAHFAIRNKVNSNSVTVPEVLGLPGTGFTVPARQLLARAPRMSSVNRQVMRVEFPFLYNQEHLLDWQEEDEAGNPTGPRHHDQIYEEVAYPMPGVLWG